MPVESLSPSHPGVPRIAAGVQASLEAMVTAAVEAIWAEVPAYPNSGDDQLRQDVTAHVRAIFLTFLAALTTGQQARRADFAVTRQQATRRVAQGISLADFLQAFRIGQLTLWQAVLDAAGQDVQAREAALLIVAQLMQVIELGSTVAGEAYVAAQQHALAESDRVRRDLLEVPEAYAEAQIARDGLAGAPGVLALPMLTSFDYLVLREDETARRLIRPRVRQFVAEDVAAGGALIATLAEFAACDLNAKTTAERLHLHVNTAYYRLERIAERTGCDLRRLADVMELLIAVRLLTASPASQAATTS